MAAVSSVNVRNWKVVLPTTMGGVSILLCAWDIYNQRIIQSMGMAWDTGAPIWPYETPAMLFFALNVPSFVISVRLANMVGLLVPWHYIIVLPAALFWWWILGAAIDLRASLRFRKTPCVVLSLVAVLMVWGFVRDVLPWVQYNQPSIVARVVVFVRTVAPLAWIATLLLLSVLNTKPDQRIIGDKLRYH